MNRSIRRLGCGLRWSEGSTGSLTLCGLIGRKPPPPGGPGLSGLVLEEAQFNRVRQVAPIHPHRRAHWRHLANTTEPSVCGGDAVLCQITVTSCFRFALLCVFLPFCSCVVCFCISSLLSQEIGEEEVFKMTYFVSSGR